MYRIRQGFPGNSCVSKLYPASKFTSREPNQPQLLKSKGNGKISPYSCSQHFPGIRVNAGGQIKADAFCLYQALIDCPDYPVHRFSDGPVYTYPQQSIHNNLCPFHFLLKYFILR